jgi:hypothetical protein
LITKVFVAYLYQPFSTVSLMRANAALFAEAVEFTNVFNKTLRGGYDCSFVSITGMTTPDGSLTIKGTASLTIENFVIR